MDQATSRPRKRPRLSIEELKHAALKSGTHRTYESKCKWWGRYL